jgi:hypothetical protein
MCEQQIKSPNAALLNSLYEMQASPTYAFRKMVLLQAENTILKLESERNDFLEALKGLIEFAEPYFDKDGFGYIGKLEAAKRCIAKAEGRL